MKIEIQNKYNLGDKVRKYKTVPIVSETVVCPVCKGNYKAVNPNSHLDEADAELYCGCCDAGYIEVQNGTEKQLMQEVYEIMGIFISVNRNEQVEWTYHIQSVPELNGREGGFWSCTVKEDDLALVFEK